MTKKSEERIIQIERLARVGKTRIEIAEEVGLSYEYVSRVIRNRGICVRNNLLISDRSIDHVKIMPTLRETAVVNRGKATAGEIARAFGCSLCMVIGHWHRAKEAGEIAA